MAEQCPAKQHWANTRSVSWIAHYKCDSLFRPNSKLLLWFLLYSKWNQKLNSDIYLEDRDFKPALKSMLNTVQRSLRMKVLWRQTHGAPRSRSERLKLVKMREYSNGMKIINIHETSVCVHKGKSNLAIIRGWRESERKMAHWPFPDGIAFNPYYRVLLGTFRLEKSDKSGWMPQSICISMLTLTKKDTSALK